MPGPKVVAVILNYGTAQEALATALRMAAGLDHVLVADNGSAASDRKVLENTFGPGRLFPTRAGDARVLGNLAFVAFPRNHGYAGGINRGVAAALELWDPTHVLLLNPDADVPPEAVRRAAKRPLSPDVAVVGFHERTPPRGWRERLLWEILSPRPWPGLPSECDQVIGMPRGPIALLTRASIDRVVASRGSLFREDLFLYHEETDFAWVLHRLGLAVVSLYEPAAFHVGGQSVQRLGLPIREYYTTRNVQIVAGTMPALRRIWVRTVHSLFAMAEVATHAARGDRARRMAVWEGLRDGWAGRTGPWRRQAVAGP